MKLIEAEDITTTDIKLWEDTVGGFQSQSIVVGQVFASDLNSLFEEHDVLIRFNLDVGWPQVLKALGVFKSTSDARRNGWDREIPDGWSEVHFKKQRKTIFCFKQPNISKLQRFKLHITLSKPIKMIKRGIRKWFK